MTPRTSRRRDDRADLSLPFLHWPRFHRRSSLSRRQIRHRQLRFHRGDGRRSHLGGSNLKPEGVIFPKAEIRPSDITDGLSKTMFIAESREERMRVWIDGRTAAHTALAYDTRRPAARCAELHALLRRRRHRLQIRAFEHAFGRGLSLCTATARCISCETRSRAASYVALCTRGRRCGRRCRIRPTSRLALVSLCLSDRLSRRPRGRSSSRSWTIRTSKFDGLQFGSWESSL